MAAAECELGFCEKKWKLGVCVGMWLLLSVSCVSVKVLEEKWKFDGFVTWVPCMCQAAKEDLVQQGWKGFYLGGNYVSGTPLSLCCSASIPVSMKS